MGASVLPPLVGSLEMLRYTWKKQNISFVFCAAAVCPASRLGV